MEISNEYLNNLIATLEGIAYTYAKGSDLTQEDLDFFVIKGTSLWLRVGSGTMGLSPSVVAVSIVARCGSKGLSPLGRIPSVYAGLSARNALYWAVVERVNNPVKNV